MMKMGYKKFVQLSLPVRIMVRKKPMYFIAFLALGAADGSLNAFLLYFTQILFDEIAGISAGGSQIGRLCLLICLFGLITSLELIINGMYNFMYGKISAHIGGLLELEIQRKISLLEPLCFEDAESLNSIEKARQGAESTFSIWIIFISLFTFYIPYFCMTGYYLYTLHPVLPFVLLVIFLPVFANQLIRYYIYSGFIDKSTPCKRAYEYYRDCIAGPPYFKETRVLCAQGFFKRRFLDALQTFSSLKWKSNKRYALLNFLMKSITLLGYLTILILLLALLLRRSITIGAFSAIYASVWKMFNLMNELIVRHIGNILQSLSSVKNFITFMNLPECKRKCSSGSRPDEITVENVSFKYPNCREYALKHINLKIRDKEVVAVVGLNGSGKSTLAKIIASVYPPTEGEIKTYPVQDISVICQRFQKYKLSLRDNIACADFGACSGLRRLKRTAKSAGLSSNFVNQYTDTVLARELGGIELSGGIWQRIAIARGLYKKSALILFDEPTASINPLEETRIFEAFREISQNKTAIYITHRLGAVKIADRIIVMKAGEIAEEGDFETLMKKDGYFAKLYLSQAQWYKKA